ncbi:MAG: DUF1840 domain-containing protein [Gammaproteobacteria bacterium]|nr:DUF1840 domain-containing protein [Gammaproteobacteria bacterium]
MLVTFESEVGRVTLFGDIAVQLIRMMGRTGAVPGAVLAAEIPEALSKLREGLATAGGRDTEPPPENDEEAETKPAVSLRHRAVPLIKLLEDAVREGSDVMWEPLGSGPLKF